MDLYCELEGLGNVGWSSSGNSYDKFCASCMFSSTTLHNYDVKSLYISFLGLPSESTTAFHCFAFRQSLQK